MKHVNNDIPEILKSSKKIAVVGISENSFRASNNISIYLKNNGFTIIPVNPNYDQVLGLTCFNSLSEINTEVDIVNIFLRSDNVLPVVQEAININAKVVWMQLGVINEEAAQLALAAGLKVIQDKCIKTEHARLL